MKLACAALAVLACNKSEPPTPAPVLVAAASEPADAARPAPPTSPIPATTRQLIVGIVDDWSSTRGSLQLFTRTDTASWVRRGPTVPIVIGRSGVAWGIGLHPQAPTKHEGDGKAPAGVFRIRSSYGYAATAPDGVKLPYARADKLECVDDPASKHYTQIVDGAIATRDWQSSEQMRGNHQYYEWVIDIAHNTSATPKAGSCIFFHVWGGDDSKTDGCTALGKDELVALMKQLDPSAEPIYVLLPRAEYEAHQAAWSLPPLG